MKNYLLLLIVFTVTCSYAQIQKELPRKSLSFQGRSSRLSIKSIILSDLNNEEEEVKAKKAKEEDCIECRKSFYGKPIAGAVDIKKTLTPIEIENGFIWIYRFNSNTAKALQFYFDEFKLPPGATLHFYDQNTDFTLGAFTQENNNPANKFVTQIFPGSHATLEYFEPRNPTFKGALKIGKIIHVFTDFGQVERTGVGFGSPGNCDVDVNCSAGSSLALEKKAVGLITKWDAKSGYTAVCSGFLINSTGNNEFKRPLFMTAGHCIPISAVGYYYDYLFYFNYENSGCADDATNPFYRAKSFQGAYVRSVGMTQYLTKTDYALLELANRPQDWTSVYYLGWDKRPIVSSGGTFNISHPLGDAKKIAIDYESPVSLAQWPAPCRNPSDLEVWKVDWNVGITQPTSSGSPLLNGFKRVIGILSGGDSRCSDSPGTDLCGNTIAHSGPDWFARMDYAWDHSNPGNVKLNTELNPANSNIEFLDGYNPNGPTTTPEILNINSITVTDNRWLNEIDKPLLSPQISYTGQVNQLQYSWSPADDFLNPKEATPILWWGGLRPPMPFTKTYTLTVISPAGNIATKDINVTIYDCENQTMNKEVCAQGPTVIGYSPQAGMSYSWSPTTYLSSGNSANPTITPPNTGTFTYTVTVTSPSCTRTDIYVIKALDPPLNPTAMPQKVADAQFGGNNYSFDRALKLAKVGSNIVLMGLSKHTLSGDHVDSNHQTSSEDGLLAVTLNANLIKSNSFDLGLSQKTFTYATSGMVEANDNGLYYINNYLIYKTDLQGNVIWNRIITGTQCYEPLGLTILNNGDIVAAVRAIYCSSGAYGNTSVIRFTPSGAVVWSKEFSGNITAIAKTNDGGLIYLTGASTSSGNLVKVNAAGTQEWSKSMVNPSFTNGRFDIVLATNDGGYVLARDYSYAYTVGSNGYYELRSEIKKVDAIGNPVWTKTLASGGVQSLKQTLDGGYILACTTEKNATIEKSEVSKGLQDIWIVKLDGAGNITGEKTFGGSRSDNAVDILQYDATTYFVAGNSESDISGDKTKNLYGGTDMWVIKFIDTQSTNPLILPPPNLSSSLTASQGCTTAVTYVPTSNTPEATFTWTRAQVVGISEPAASGVGSINENLTNTTTSDIQVTYTYTIKDSRCRTNSQNVIATIKPTSQQIPPAVITPGSILPACGSVILNAPIRTDLSYEWIRSSGGTNSIVSTQPSFSATQTGTYTVTIIKGSCSSISTPMNITINPIPTANITADMSTILCTDQGVTLSTPNGANYSYEWWRNGLNIFKSSRSHTVLSTEPGTYKVIVKNASGCENSDTESVFTHEALITPAGQLCEGGSVTLNASASWSPVVISTYSFTWQEYKNSTWTNIGTGSSITVTKAANYRVKASNPHCTSTSPELRLTVLSNPKPTITRSGNTCGTVTLTSSQGAQYSWSNGSTNRSITGYGGNGYYVQVTNANGCKNTSNTFNVASCSPPPPDPCNPPVDLTAARTAPEVVPCTESMKRTEQIILETATFPNPANSELTLRLPVAADFDIPIKIYSQLGYIVYDEIIVKGKTEIILNTRNLNEGIYLIKMELPGKRMLNKKAFVIH